MIPTIDYGNSFKQGPDGLVPSGWAGKTAATWSPTDKTTNMSLSGADLVATATGSTFEAIRSTKNNFNTSTGGKFFWKITLDSIGGSGDCLVGLLRTADAIVSGGTWDNAAFQYALWRDNNQIRAKQWVAVPASLPVYTATASLWFALDIPNRLFFTGLNGVWNNSGDPVGGTGESFNSMPIGENFAPVFRTDNTAGTTQTTLISDWQSLLADCPSGYTAGLPV